MLRPHCSRVEDGEFLGRSEFWPLKDSFSTSQPRASPRVTETYTQADCLQLLGPLCRQLPLASFGDPSIRSQPALTLSPCKA